VRLTPFPPLGENIRPLPCSSFSPKSQWLFGGPGSPNGEGSDSKAFAPPRQSKVRLTPFPQHGGNILTGAEKV